MRKFLPHINNNNNKGYSFNWLLPNVTFFTILKLVKRLSLFSLSLLSSFKHPICSSSSVFHHFLCKMRFRPSSSWFTFYNAFYYCGLKDRRIKRIRVSHTVDNSFLYFSSNSRRARLFRTELERFNMDMYLVENLRDIFLTPKTGNAKCIFCAKSYGYNT